MRAMKALWCLRARCSTRCGRREFLPGVVDLAGYIYSGPVAANAFACVDGSRTERVVLVGPTHRVYVRGLVSADAARLATPLGEVDVDAAALAQVPQTPNAVAHAREHSIEVMLPFVQMLAPRAKVVPLLASDVAPEVVGAALDALWGGSETLIVISSDLSHYHRYQEGRRLDIETCARIAAADPVDDEHACGAVAINGLSWLARKKQLAIELVDLRSSGDTAGDRSQVVGYSAFAYREAA
jgi:AmmeMemoRadiSam system protein B